MRRNLIFIPRRFIWMGLLLINLPIHAQFYQATNFKIGFFSTAPVEDIKADSEKAIVVFSKENGEISIKVPMRSFQFEKALMQEHFNENYIESERFPYAILKGKIQDFQNLENGSGKTCQLIGELTVHGITKHREIPVSLSLSEDGNTLNIYSEFKVACADHQIKIPKILWQNIAEEVAVKAQGELKYLEK